MYIIPAIDISDGKCVRLRQGKKEHMTVYDSDPVKVAQRWADAGARMIHLVDLDRAIDGSSHNVPVIDKITSSVYCGFELGGGLRNMQILEETFRMNLRRIILGTAAVENPEFTRDAITEFGTDRIVIGIDARDGMASIKGWTEDSSMSAVDLAKTMEDAGARSFVYTDIVRDGMLTGINIPALTEFIEATHSSVIASGGVSSLQDVLQLVKMPQHRLEGVIIGKALYEKQIDLHEAIVTLRSAEGSC